MQINFLLQIIFTQLYRQIKLQHNAVVEERLFWANKFNMLINICYLSACIRFLLFAYFLWGDKWPYYTQHLELFLSFMTRNRSIDENIILLIGLEFAFLTYINYFVYLNNDCSIIWILLHDLGVRNINHFRKQFKHIIRNRILRIYYDNANLYRKLISIVHYYKSIWKGIERFGTFRHSLHYFPYLSEPCRIRAVILFAFTEFKIIIFSIIFVIFFYSVFIMYAFWIFPLYSWTRATLCCIDLFILLMLINSIGKILLPTLFSLSFFANVLGDFLKGLSLTLPKMVKDNRTTNTSHLILLKEFYIKHSLVVDFVLRTSNFYSKIIIVFTLTNGPINAYMTTFMYFKKSSLLDDNNLPMFFIIICQIIIAFLFSFIITILSNKIHQCSSCLVPIQTNVQIFSIKWKLMLKYEQVNSKHRITYQNGPFGGICTRYLFNMIIKYFTLMSYVLQLMS